MERAIASYQAQGHDVDVVEVVDDEATWFRVIVDGELLPGDQQFDRPPTDAEATAIIDEWTQSFRATRHSAEQGTTTTDAAGPARQEPFSAEDIREHAKHDHIAAVFADRAHAETAVDEMRALGLGSEHLGVAVRGTDPIAFEHDEQTDLVHDLEVGAAAGTPIGALAGLALVAVAVPGIAVGGILALGGASALWGLLMGSYVGVAVGAAGWTTHETFEDVAREPGEVMVVVCSHGHANTVNEVMPRCGGRLHRAKTTEPRNEP